MTLGPGHTCPTCRAPIPADIGWGLVACPYCNTALDMGPAPDQEEKPFDAGPSDFLPSHHEKPFGASAPGEIPPPPSGGPEQPTVNRIGQFGGGQAQFQPPPAFQQPPPAFHQPPSSGSSTTIVFVIAVIMAALVLGSGCLMMLVM